MSGAARRVANNVTIRDKVAFIELTQGYVALVDLDDLPLIEGHCRFAKVVKREDGTVRKIYVAATTRDESGKCHTLLIHRTIMNAPTDLQVDHRVANALDNRRTNLRVCKQSDNAKNHSRQYKNKSGLKGVTFVQERRAWKAQISVDKKKINIGFFPTPQDAASAYDKAAIEHFGAFANTNNTTLEMVTP